MGVLQAILEQKRSELVTLAGKPRPEGYTPRAVDLSRAKKGRLSLIAEIKLRSPSAGPLSRHLSVAERARAYEDAGADMISVLCDERFFDGNFQHLVEARKACNLPLLCKEFVIDEAQLDLARAFGADAVLLIVRCLERSQLQRLVQQAEARQLLPLVEVYTEVEVQWALDSGARYIGVNARDLDTLEMNAERAAKILDSLPDDVVRLHLSGIREPADLKPLLASRADGALIGETLMRQDDPRTTLASLVSAARSTP
jgi:indole-3-glycerol phosphate synthase